MVTEADREAAAQLLGGATPDGLLEGRCDSLSLIQTLARHRTASTAALTAEIQRLREKIESEVVKVLNERVAYFSRTTGHFDRADTARSYAATKEQILRRLAALSTPSEVSEPDQIGGVFAGRPGMFDKPNPDEVAGTYSAFEVSEPVADETKGMSKCNRCGALWPSAPPGVIHKCQCSGGYCYPVAEHIGGEGENYPMQARVWKRQATNEWVLEIEGEINDTYMVSRHTQPLSVNAEDVPGLPTLYATPPNKNGDAVREALAKVRETVALSLAFIGRDQGTSRIDNTLTQLCVELTKADNLALATLAKHGGAEA